ncbi:MAG TPA: hypothetical protein VI612_04215 [Candidatus Nanoarchaeia archaeon]|nr:hypothetical protein [Candidatus Nanoarchaeia archaeon]
MSVKWFLIIVLLASIVQAADWVEVNVSYNWDRKSTGFCKQSGQCFISNSYNEQWDNFPDRYWSQLNSSLKPKCISNGQYISDNYCDNGKWSSRTRLVALQLLNLALNNNPNDFALYCDRYDAVLNKYNYLTDYGLVTNFIRLHCLQPGGRRLDNCANSICVVKYGSSVAFGMSINTDINSSTSPLQALNKSASLCNSAINNDNDADGCGSGVWYNHDIQSVFYLPNVASFPSPSASVNNLLIQPFDKLKNYVFTVVHKTDVPEYNYSFFNFTPAFKQLYLAKSSSHSAYGFHEFNVTPAQRDYAGWYFENITLPRDACGRLVKIYDDTANCESQPSTTEFFIVANKPPPKKNVVQRSIVDAWNDMSGKLRIKK